MHQCLVDGGMNHATAEEPNDPRSRPGVMPAIVVGGR